MAPYLQEPLLPVPRAHPSKKPTILKPSSPVLDSPRPLAWTRDSFSDISNYTYVLTESEIHEINQGLASFKRSGLDGSEINQTNFPLRTLGKVLQDLARDLHEGKGFFVLRGLNPNVYTVEDNTIIFLGVSSFIGGLLGRQTDDGRVFGHVCDAGYQSVSQENRPLRYSNRGSTFHNDLYCDIIAMQARSCAEIGGSHLIASASTVYEELVSTQPELAAALLRPNWPLDLRRRFAATEVRPIFFHHERRLLSSVLPDALIGFEDIERQPGLATLSPIQQDAHKALQSLCQKHSISLPMQPGDLSFVNNFAILHAREAFCDSPAHKRYLVRLWLKNETLAWKLPEALQNGNQAVFNDETLQSEWNIVPEPRFRFQLYERQSP